MEIIQREGQTANKKNKFRQDDVWIWKSLNATTYSKLEGLLEKLSFFTKLFAKDLARN